MWAMMTVRGSSAAARPAVALRRHGRRSWQALVIALFALAIGGSCASPAFASGPGWELFATHLPEKEPELTAVPNEIQLLIVSGIGGTPNVGKFALALETVALEEEQTKPLPYGATAAEMQKALEGLKKLIGAGNVIVTGGPESGEKRWSYVVKFVGKLAGREVGELVPIEITATKGEEGEIEKHDEEPIEGEAESRVLAKGGSHYELLVTNMGTEASSGKITVTDTLPSGLSTVASPGATGWDCSEGASQTKVTCTTEDAIAAGSKAPPITFEADTASIKEGELLVNHARIEGGGTAAAIEVSDDTHAMARPIAVGGAAEVTSAVAVLSGTVNPGGGELISCEFEYGTTNKYGARIPCLKMPPAERIPVAVSAAPITGLKSNTTYHFRIVAINVLGTGESVDATLTTAPSPEEAERRQEEEAASERKDEEAAAVKKRAEEDAAREREEQVVATQHGAEALAKKHEEEALVRQHEAEALARRLEDEALSKGSALAARERGPDSSVSLDGSSFSLQGTHAAFRLTCAGTATCVGKVTLAVERMAGKGKKKRVKREAVGTASFSVLAGTTSAVKVTLNVARELLRVSHGDVVGTLTISKTSPTPTNTQIRSVRLAEQK